MKLIYVSILVFLSQALQAQIKQKSEERAIQLLKNVIVDSNRKDWSMLDRIYLISKAITPASSIAENGDTLVVSFEMPKWVKPDTSLGSDLKHFDRLFYNALSTAFTRDSMKYNQFKIHLCLDSLKCAEALYNMRQHPYRKYTLEQRLNFFFYGSMWRTGRCEIQGYKHKKSIVIYSYIDASHQFGKPYYVESYYQSICGTVADLIHQEPRKVRRKYRNIFLIICSNNTLNQYWRYPLTNRQYTSMYRAKFYETAQRYQE
jgi:hypothetical protein